MTGRFSLLLGGLIVAHQMFVATSQTWAADGEKLAPSPAVVLAMEEFRKIGLPGYFAVSEDGSVSGFALCRTGEACGPRVEKLAIRFCSTEGGGKPCRIFANETDRLWRGEVVMPDTEDLELVRRGWRVFATSVSWPEGSPVISGWSIMPEGGPVGWVKITRPGKGGPCFGTYAAKDINLGQWQLACSFELTASGTYVRESDRWVLEGKSPSGDRVRIVTLFR